MTNSKSHISALMRSGLAAILLTTASATLGSQEAQPAQPAQAAASDSNTYVRPARASWVADRRGFDVGDIITVVIDDYTISTAIKDNLAADNRRRNIGGTVRLPSKSSQSAGLELRSDSDMQQRGSARRENRFQNEMSVRVVAVGNNGLLQVRGNKNITVDKSEQNVVFEGWVRSQDISSQNMVESYRVADATLMYESPGPLGKPKSGIIATIIGIFTR